MQTFNVLITDDSDLPRNAHGKLPSTGNLTPVLRERVIHASMWIHVGHESIRCLKNKIGLIIEDQERLSRIVYGLDPNKYLLYVKRLEKPHKKKVVPLTRYKLNLI
jgi:hypothetical protein